MSNSHENPLINRLVITKKVIDSYAKVNDLDPVAAVERLAEAQLILENAMTQVALLDGNHSLSDATTALETYQSLNPGLSPEDPILKHLTFQVQMAHAREELVYTPGLNSMNLLTGIKSGEEPIELLIKKATAELDNHKAGEDLIKKSGVQASMTDLEKAIFSVGIMRDWVNPNSYLSMVLDRRNLRIGLYPGWTVYNPFSFFENVYLNATGVYGQCDGHVDITNESLEKLHDSGGFKAQAVRKLGDFNRLNFASKVQKRIRLR